MKQGPVLARYPVAPAESKDGLDAQPVLGFHIGDPDFEVVEVGQIIRRPELVEDGGWVDIVAEELRVVAPALVGDGRALCHPFTYGGVQLASAPRVLTCPDDPII